MFPEAQLQVLRQGGYDVPLDDEYLDMEQHVIRNYGRFLMALTRGELEPFHPEQVEFIEMVNGERKPRNHGDESWLRFLKQYPELQAE